MLSKIKEIKKLIKINKKYYYKDPEHKKNKDFYVRTFNWNDTHSIFNYLIKQKKYYFEQELEDKFSGRANYYLKELNNAKKITE